MKENWNEIFGEARELQQSIVDEEIHQGPIVTVVSFSEAVDFVIQRRQMLALEKLSDRQYGR